MKAGSAGSSPDRVTKIMASPIQPLRNFLVAVGEAVTNLNTTVIGLDAVEKGHEKPETLNVSWNPQDRIAAARKARRFVLEAVLVRVSEAIYEFILATAQLPQFGSVRNAWNSDTHRVEMLADVAGKALNSDHHLIAGAALLIHWRNRVVHPRSSASLTHRQQKELRAASVEIEKNFAGLSVDRLLDNFKAGQPTLKDISSLIAMSIRMAREVDKTVNDLQEDGLDIMLDHYGLRARIAEIEAQTTPNKYQASVLRMLQSTAPGLVEAYSRLRAATTSAYG